MSVNVGAAGGAAGDLSSCPLCGQPNRCAMTLPAAQQPAQCWCVAATFPESLTRGLDGTRCVCADCAAKAVASSEGNTAETLISQE